VIAFTLESLFPPLILPGARMGISNVFILLCAIYLGSIYGYATLIVKILLGSIFSGNISSIIYSLPAGLISLTLELALFLWINKASIVASSIAGAVVNVTIQNLVFCLVTDSAEYLSYLPYLSLTGVIGGLAVGFIVLLTVKKLKFNFLNTNSDEENNLEY
jgi:heptaprenyl diphosphate synthase